MTSHEGSAATVHHSLDPRLEKRLRDTFARSREVVLRAHERAERAVERATRIREALRADRDGLTHPAQLEARRRVRLLQLAVEENARSIREKDRFLATVAHELRQPLNAAVAALRVTETGGERAIAARTVLRRQLLQMARLVDDLLDMSRLSLDVMDMRLGHVDLSAVLADALTTIDPEIQALRLAVIHSPAGEPVCVWGDESRLRQVFSNVLSNAMRYTPPGGTIALSAAVQRATVVVDVTDTGQGVSEEDLPRIFEPFTRGAGRGDDGLGIGLSLVRAITELHRGSVAAYSAGVGKGSTFTVTLPLCPHLRVRNAADGP